MIVQKSLITMIAALVMGEKNFRVSCATTPDGDQFAMLETMCHCEKCKASKTNKVRYFYVNGALQLETHPTTLANEEFFKPVEIQEINPVEFNMGKPTFQA